MRISLGIPMTLSEIGEYSGADCIRGREDRIIKYISTDTRELSAGDLFVALKGKKSDGANYAKYAERLGAYTLSCDPDSTLTVKDTGDALLRIAKGYKTKLRNLSYTVGITGSVGKTTTKEFLAVICAEKYKTHKTNGNYNNLIGLPMTILSAPEDTELLILEMGMNTSGEISRLSKCATPDVGIITNIGTAHIGLLGSRKAIAAAKLEILDGMDGGKLVIPYVEPLLSDVPCKLTFSSSDNNADIYVESHGAQIEVYSNDANSYADFSPIGKHFLDCAAAALAASQAINVDLEYAIRRLSLISSDNLRQSLVFMKDFTILDDSYNASLESVRADLLMLGDTKGYAHLGALIGNVFELGVHSPRIHKEIGKFAGSCGLDQLYLIGDCSDDVISGATSVGFPADRIFTNYDLSDPSLTARQIYENHLPGELILFKASNRAGLWRVIEKLKEMEKD